MVAASALQSIVSIHILQFTVAITCVGALVLLAGRRWPHFTFLVCMLALVKCLVPPLITSPAGVFTRHPGLAFSPQMGAMDEGALLELKQYAQNESTVASDQRVLPVAAEQAKPGWGWFPLFAGVWLIGVAVVVGRAAWMFSRLQVLLRQAKAASPDLQLMTERIAKHLGVRRDVRLVVSDENYGPACVGLIRPTLILPARLASRWSPRLLRPVISHELIHARRGDVIWGYLQFFAQVIWWFHPLVWWLGKRANILCERCCDEEVVAGAQCSQAEYAESLVRVLEFRSTYRAVPLCYAMSPVQITTQRLERIMKRGGNFAKGTSILSWGMAVLLAVLVIPGMQWATAQEDESTQVQEETYRAKVGQAIQQGDFESAIEMLRPVVANDSENAGAIFYLGYALHASGELEEALEYHKKAAQFKEMKPIATYNWACALALQGKKDEALDKLAEAVKVGFVHQSALTDDSDLEILFDEPRFKKLVERTNRDRELREVAGKFDFWVGSWVVFGKDGTRLGTNTITKSDRGRVLTEKWTSRSGNTGTSINFFHPGDKKWKQTWVDDQGGVIEYVGEFTNGRMEFKGTMFGADGKETRSLMTFTPEEDGSVTQLIKSSEDDGKTWEVAFEGSYQRKTLKSHELGAEY